MKVLLAPIAVLLAPVAVLLTTTPVLANSLACSSADQSLAYTHETSNGGVPLDRATLRYQGLTQSSWSPGDPDVEFDVDGRKDIRTDTEGQVKITTFVAQASGTIRADGQSLGFSKLVLCEERIAPICPLCP